MSLIIGEDDFGEVITRKQGFVDKSLFIKEIFDNNNVKVSVIVRPRRFGKTLNLSMLRHFLASKVNMMETKGMFDDLKIAQEGQQYMQHQGKYPVIFVSFKSIKGSHFDTVYNELALLIGKTYAQHRVLLSGDTLYNDEKKIFEAILNRTASKEDLLLSLANLSEYLHRHYQVKPWILIDEYDTPIQEGYLNGYYKEMVEVMRGLFSNALKGNESLHRAVVTGILRVAKENLFSGLNNVRVYSVINKQYSEHFGFTEAEVDAVLPKNNLGHLSIGIKAWYNGYQIGNTRIYNPWSIASCIEEGGKLRPYWVNTSENGLIKKILAESSSHFKGQFESILNNQAIEAHIDESMIFSNLNENSIWGLLLFSGYLTTVSVQEGEEDTQLHCSLRSPNREISALYRTTIRSWFAQGGDESSYQHLLHYLTEGQPTLFLPYLKKILLESTSYFDTSGQQPEKFYHGLVLGLVVSLSKTHTVCSNGESGLGRYDVMLIPKDDASLLPSSPSLRAALLPRGNPETSNNSTPKPGIILEFKVAKPDEDLEESAKEALEQIQQKNYVTKLSQEGIAHTVTIGLSFRGKEVGMAFEANVGNQR